MGCGGSRTDVTKRKTRQPLNEQSKSSILVFGMPDSGQTVFIKSIEKCFYSVGGFNQNPFAFVAVPSDRESRRTWLAEYEKQPRVVASFFFVDVSSPASVLLSVKTANWLRSQLGKDDAQPHLIACVKNPKEMTNFTSLKEMLAPGVEVATFNDQTQSDIQRYVEYISASAVKKAGLQANE